MNLVGQRFGHIRVSGVVGQGGMGEVYSGYDETLERKVALKILHSDYRLDDEARERLLREARALSRLDHPNICRIHDYIDNGESDLLVLEYIDGRTLDEAQREKTTRAEKLRIAISIAGVLVAAHRAGIVHRDLKPENVMLTKTGEVKVLDFGLARWLNKGRAHSSDKRKAVTHLRVVGTGQPNPDETSAFPAPAPSPSAEREFLATAVGITVGTPIYMSPEQARGEPLTPASDMFSFGLLLQFLFSGTEAHAGVDTAREVMLRVARGETNRVQNVPRDVASLINRLKMFAPADRPTAIETLERLQWLAEKPRRFARRAVASAIVLIALVGVWRYTVDLQRERVAAVAARAVAVRAQADAEHRRDQAETLIEFMIGDLRTKLNDVGRLEILDDVAKRVMAYIDELDPSTLSASELARNAKAVNQLGDVRVSQGKSAEALALFRRSLVLSNEALRREPRNPQVLLVHGETHYWIANGLRLLGNYDGALQHMRAYMKDGDALASIDPRSDAYQLERAYGHSGVGFILERKGQLQEASAHYRTSLEVKQLLAARTLGDAEAQAKAQAEVARAFNKVGVNLFNQGDLRGSVDYLRRETDIYRALMAREPKQMQWKQRLVVNLGLRGGTLQMAGDGDGSLELTTEALKIAHELATLDPANVEWQSAVAVALKDLATVEASRGQTPVAVAVELMEKSWTKIRAVRKQTPTHVGVALAAGMIAADYGRLLAARGDNRGIELLEESVRILEPLRDDRFARWQLCRSLLFLGETLRSPDAAAIAWERAELALPTPVSASSPVELEIWSRLLIHRQRHAEAREVLTRLQQAGFATAELQRLFEANSGRQMAAGLK